MEETSSSSERGLIDFVFSWSIKDVLNKDLYKHKVKKVPMTFSSSHAYFSSFIPLLIEETHADLSSSFATIAKTPGCELCLDSETRAKRILSGGDSTDHYYYQVLPRKLHISHKVGSYEPEMGDLIALTNRKPKCIDDLSKPGSPYTIALVLQTKINGLEKILIEASRPPLFEECEGLKTVSAYYLINMTTNLRIWNALSHNPNGGKIINSVLEVDSTEPEDDCRMKLSRKVSTNSTLNLRDMIGNFDLNESQEEVVKSVIVAISNDQGGDQSSNEPRVKLIWGPPGTGKTKTICSLLFALRKLRCKSLPTGKCRTLTCAPTNIAVLHVATGLMKLMLKIYDFDVKKYRLGDIVLLGNGKRMNIDQNIDGGVRDIFLDYRVGILVKCFAPSSGWTGSLYKMLDFLKNIDTHYRAYLQKQEMLRLDLEKEAKMVGKMLSESEYVNQDMSIEEFAKMRFENISEGLKFCLNNIYIHLPASFISLKVVKMMFEALKLLESFESLLHSLVKRHVKIEKHDDQSIASVTMLESFKSLLHSLVKRHVKVEKKDDQSNAIVTKFMSSTVTSREVCCEILETLCRSFRVPNISEDGIVDSYNMKKFCLSNSCIVFCTASTSAKLFIEGMNPFDLLVIDEAAQLKECESAIPLQIPCLRYAVLIGDERQLPALVKSKISENAEFGRSMFERLVVLGCKKHLLNMQYRMHPDISFFPNREFYHNQILDAPKLSEKSHQPRFLDGDMYGSYSFFNIGHGKEEFGYGHSSKNVMEVAVACELVSKLYKASVSKKQKVSVGILSPYKAQVFAIQEKLGKEYENSRYLSVSVRSVDGFQGGEEDVIIMSTVRSNVSGSVGFLANHQRTNVALTRARFCLWILGHQPTLIKSGTVWKKLVVNAIDRKCFFNVEEDTNLAGVITSSLVDLNRFDVLLSVDSPMFQNTRWKVRFSEDFSKTMAKTKSVELRDNVFYLLEKLATGWRESYNKTPVANEMSIEQYTVNHELGCDFLVWTVDVIKDNSSYIQVLRVWDMLPLANLGKLLKRLKLLSEAYSVQTMDRCTFKCCEGDLAVPMKWPVDSDADKKSIVFEDEFERSLSRPFASMRLMDDL